MRNSKVFDYIRNVRDKAAVKGINAFFLLHIEKSHLMRLGNSSVSLNTSEHLTRLDIEVLDGKKTGFHSVMGEINSESFVEEALKIAVDKASLAFENNYQPRISGLVKNIEKSNQFDERVENLDSDYKVDFFKKVIDQTGSQYSYSGSWSSGSIEKFLVSTENKFEAWHLGTDQQMIIVLQHPTKKWELKSLLSGWRLDDLKVEDAVNYFKELLPVYENSNGYKIEPGEYTVAFGPGSISEFLFASTDIAFNGQCFEEKQSWLCHNKVGDKIAPEFINFFEDPDSDLVFGYNFDDVGTPRSRYPLIENGIFKGLMYDIQTASRYKKELTGHSLLYTNNAVLQAGKDTPNILEAVKDLGKVIFIPDLHYTGIPSPTKGVITGSSRYNAVLIENGKMVAPLFSCRLTEKISKIFNNIIKMSKESVSFNLSNTYERRTPFALGMPSYIVCEKIMITDSADSF